MTLEEIKLALDAGKTVCWSHTGYEVRKHTKNEKEYNIICLSNNHCIGLTWEDGITMNGKEKDFFIKE